MHNEEEIGERSKMNHHIKSVLRKPNEKKVHTVTQLQKATILTFSVKIGYEANMKWQRRFE